MAETTPIKLNKKKFSEFEFLNINDNLTTLDSTYLVGYKRQSPVNTNTQLNIASLINTVSKKVKADILAGGGQIPEGGGTGSDTPTPSPRPELPTQTPFILAQDYERTDMGFSTVTTNNGVKVLVIDTAQYSDYIQFNDIPLSAMNQNQTVMGQKMNTFDICLANTALGESFKVYLPNFCVSNKSPLAAFRIWRDDPYDSESKTIDPSKIAHSAVVFVSERANTSTGKEFDWFAKFIVLGMVSNDNIVNVSRTQEVSNLFDDDEIAGE